MTDHITRFGEGFIVFIGIVLLVAGFIFTVEHAREVGLVFAVGVGVVCVSYVIGYAINDLLDDARSWLGGERD